jgi:predicted AAA+ superfamily ATPase
MSGRGAIIMAECPKSKDVVLLISGNSSLNGKAATEEFPEHLDLVFLDFHCFPLRFATFVAVKSRFSRECRVFLERYVFFVEKRVHSFQESWKSIPEH